MARPWVYILLAAAAFSVVLPATRADFESELLHKFQKQNQAGAEQLKREVVRLLAQTPTSSPNPVCDLQLLQKLLGRLHDDNLLPRDQRAVFVRQLRERLDHYKQQVNASSATIAPLGNLGPTTLRPAATLITGGGSVNVPDGGTRVVSSVGAVSEARNEAGVPLLGKVPSLDRGFRNVGQGRSVIGAQKSISVRIIIMEEEEARFLRQK
jgi:hypothetical protein